MIQTSLLLGPAVLDVIQMLVEEVHNRLLVPVVVELWAAAAVAGFARLHLEAGMFPTCCWGLESNEVTAKKLLKLDIDTLLTTSSTTAGTMR